MPHFGLSLYPEHQTSEQLKESIEALMPLEPERIFTCLISSDDLKGCRALCDLAHQYNLKVIADVSDAVFERYQIDTDLEFFKNLGLDGIRIDDGFSPDQILALHQNNPDLIIEVNACSDELCTHFESNGFDPENLQASFNFYPQRYSALGLEYFKKHLEGFKALGIPAGAFISSNHRMAMGPWPLREGLCSLEICRDQQPALQAALLGQLGVEEILVANVPYLEQEIEDLISFVKTGVLDLYFGPLLDPDKTEPFFNRSFTLRKDQSDYLIRLMPRLPELAQILDDSGFRACDIKPGDLVLCLGSYPRYGGELQIALKRMPADPRKLVLARLLKSGRLFLEPAVYAGIEHIRLHFKR